MIPIRNSSRWLSGAEHVMLERFPFLCSEPRASARAEMRRPTAHHRLPNRYTKTTNALTAVCACLWMATVVAGAGGFDRAIEALMPRVVKLYGLGTGVQAGYGTGVIVSEDGLVLTVLSLLIDARDIRAVTSDGTRYSAVVVHRDATRQLALLRLQPADDAAKKGGTGDAQDAPANRDAEATRMNSRVKFMPFFDTGVGQDAGDPGAATLSPGDWVIAAGNPFKVADGAEAMSIAHGVFSTRTRLDARRRVKDFPYTGDVLVFDAITSNPGGEGSALVDLDGRFLGMVGRVVVSNRTHTHVNYALPIDVLRDFLGEALRSVLPGEPPAPTATAEKQVVFDHGLRIARTGYQKVLPFVDRVRRDSPAERAGIRKDDLILSVNGRPVSDAEVYDERMKALTPDQAVELVIRRGRSIMTVRLAPEGK